MSGSFGTPSNLNRFPFEKSRPGRHDLFRTSLKGMMASTTNQLDALRPNRFVTKMGDRFEQCRHLPMVRIEALVVSDIKSLIRDGVLPPMCFVIRSNDARFTKALSIQVNAIDILHSIEPTRLYANSDTFDRPENVYLSTEVIRYLYQMRAIVDRYNRVLIDASGNTVNAYFKSRVTYTGYYSLPHEGKGTLPLAVEC